MPEPLTPEREAEIRKQAKAAPNLVDRFVARTARPEGVEIVAIGADWQLRIAQLAPAWLPFAELAAEAPAAVPALLAEIDRLRARVTELEALKPARFQDCQTCGAGHEHGQPCSTCAFESQMAAAKAATSSGSSAEGDRPKLCRCGHTRDRHVEPPGTPICRDCPGDEERSWKHPFTSKAGA